VCKEPAASQTRSPRGALPIAYTEPPTHWENDTFKFDTAPREALLSHDLFKFPTGEAPGSGPSPSSAPV
jgi:hypothetical protein